MLNGTPSGEPTVGSDTPRLRGRATPETLKAGCIAWVEKEGQPRRAEILSIKETKSGKQFYCNFDNFNKRLDEWVLVARVDFSRDVEWPNPDKDKAKDAKTKKASTANNKKAAAAAKAEEAESAKWDQGAKGRSKADEKAEKAAAAAAKKAELDRLKREEEANTPDVKSKAPKAGDKKKGGAGGSGKATPVTKAPVGGLDDALSSFSANNIDDAIAALDLTGESSARDKVGAKAGQIDAHPERRFKVSWERAAGRQAGTIRWSAHSFIY